MTEIIDQNRGLTLKFDIGMARTMLNCFNHNEDLQNFLNEIEKCPLNIDNNGLIAPQKLWEEIIEHQFVTMHVSSEKLENFLFNVWRILAEQNLENLEPLRCDSIKLSITKLVEEKRPESSIIISPKQKTRKAHVIISALIGTLIAGVVGVVIKNNSGLIAESAKASSTASTPIPTTAAEIVVTANPNPQDQNNNNKVSPPEATTTTSIHVTTPIVSNTVNISHSKPPRLRPKLPKKSDRIED